MEKEFPELIRSVGLLSVAPDSIPSNCSEAVSEEASQVSLSADDRGRSEENNQEGIKTDEAKGGGSWTRMVAIGKYR